MRLERCPGCRSLGVPTHPHDCPICRERREGTLGDLLRTCRRIRERHAAEEARREQPAPGDR